MVNTREIAAGVIGAVMLAIGGTYLYSSYRAAPFGPLQPEASNVATLNIPPVDQMCRSLGATEGDALKQCQADQGAAGEFVIAWMAYNNFIVGGAISLDQIEALASLDDASPLSDPSLGLDPGAGFDPGANPSLLGGQGSPSQSASGVDPVTGAPLGFLQSPAQLALYCLQMSGDWVTLHDCISENDVSTQANGIQ